MEQGKMTHIPKILKTFENEILADWMQEQFNSLSLRKDLVKENALREHSRQLLKTIIQATQTGDINNIQTANWQAVKNVIEEVSRTQCAQGFSPSETATFIFSLKQPLFAKLKQELEQNPELLADELWTATMLIDKLGLYSTEIYLKSREQIIKRQQEEMLELSTPVVKLWEGILALPMIGTLDSSRTQVVMENLLQKFIETGCELAIIDITGVPNVDTLVAQHLLKTITAARLMGAECLISGVRPQIAQTIVHLGVDLTGVTTKATLAEAFRLALQMTGRTLAYESSRSSVSEII